MLIVGLGNIGREYENTYHNVGFIFADKLVDKLGEKFKDKNCKSLCSVFFKGGEKTVVAKPETYMNLSGDAVKELLGFYKFATDDLVVVYDDIDLPCGKIRARLEGSAGTHNGMRNIIARLGVQNFLRVRIGIGRPEGEMELKDYVTSKIKGDNVEKIATATDKVAQSTVEFLMHKDKEDFLRDLNKSFQV